MQTAMINVPSTIPAMQGGQTGQTADTGGADFMAMMMQMAGGGGTGTEGLEELLGMFPSGQTKEEDNTAAMQQMAGMFAGMPFDFTVAPSPMEYKDNEAMAAFAAAVPAWHTTAQNSTQNLTLLMEAMNQAPTNSAGIPMGQLEQMGQMGQTAANPTDILAEVPLLDALSATDPKLAMELRNAAANAIGESTLAPTEAGEAMKAAYTLQQTTGLGRVIPTDQQGLGKAVPKIPVKEAERPDVEAMQQAVDSGKFLQQTSMLRDTGIAAPHTMSILQQVSTGITGHLAAGEKDEFVLQLKPEGLGSITVRMVENEGKISLSITTSSLQAQNALNGELNSLKEALRPFNAEVSQIISQESAGFQQSFGEHRHGQQGEQNQQSRYWQQEGETPREAEGSYTQRLEATALNAYI